MYTDFDISTATAEPDDLQSLSQFKMPCAPDVHRGRRKIIKFLGGNLI